MNGKSNLEVEKQINEFFQYKREVAKLQYEVNILQKNNKQLMELRNQLVIMNRTLLNIDSKIKDNNDKIFKKLLELDNILERIAPLSFIFKELSEEDRMILELRYKKRISFTYMVNDIHKSKSSISRRNNKILSIIAKQLNQIEH